MTARVTRSTTIFAHAFNNYLQYRLTQITMGTLLGLADELIDQILAEVKWGSPTTPPPAAFDVLQFYERLAQDTASIQSVRLTCRRLYSRTSALLLPAASVSISDPSSIDRLEQIAGHGAFAPHVKAVRVAFNFYEADLAADARKLAAYLLHIWRESSLLTGPMWSRVFDDWDAFCHVEEAAHDPKDEEQRGDSESIQLLSSLHLEYQRRYEAQKPCLALSGIRRIASAMARMPRATRLVLDDGPDAPHGPNSCLDTEAAATATATPLAERELSWLVAPTRWTTAFKLGRNTPPIEALFSFPAAVHKAGVELTGFRIHRLGIPGEFPIWWLEKSLHRTGPPPREVSELREACRALRVFEVTPDYGPRCCTTARPTVYDWPRRSRSWLWHLPVGQLFEWMTTAANGLTHIHVDVQTNELSYASYDLSEKLVRPWPWPHLQVFHQKDGYLNRDVLAELLAATPGTLAELYLDDLDLGWPREGVAWTYYLDELRAQCCRTASSRAATGRCPLTVRLRRPRGAEFYPGVLPKSEVENLLSLFDSVGDDGFSAVDRFLNGLSDRNPMAEAARTPLYSWTRERTPDGSEFAVLEFKYR